MGLAATPRPPSTGTEAGARSAQTPAGRRQYRESTGTSRQVSPSGQTITRPASVSARTNIMTASAISQRVS